MRHYEEWDIPYPTELDRGYGTESAADSITIVKDGEDYSVMAYGLHFLSENDLEWEVDLSNEECIELIKEYERTKK